MFRSHLVGIIQAIITMSPNHCQLEGCYKQTCYPSITQGLLRTFQAKLETKPKWGSLAMRLNALEELLKTVKAGLSYTSSSESDGENLNADFRKSPSLSPFHKQIPTPNFHNIKYKLRRKAVNYIGKKITKDLFHTAKNKEKTVKKVKEFKKVPRDRRLNEDINKMTKGSKKKESKTLEKHGWYCHGCKVDRLDDMRQCQKCQKWYHEVCVGLTKDDEEQFICPECN